MSFVDERGKLHCEGACNADIYLECDCMCADCFDKTKSHGMRCSCALCPCEGSGDATK